MVGGWWGLSGWRASEASEPAASIMYQPIVVRIFSVIQSRIQRKSKRAQIRKLNTRRIPYICYLCNYPGILLDGTNRHLSLRPHFQEVLLLYLI